MQWNSRGSPSPTHHSCGLPDDGRPRRTIRIGEHGAAVTYRHACGLHGRAAAPDRGHWREAGLTLAVLPRAHHLPTAVLNRSAYLAAQLKTRCQGRRWRLYFGRGGAGVKTALRVGRSRKEGVPEPEQFSHGKVCPAMAIPTGGQARHPRGLPFLFWRQRSATGQATARDLSPRPLLGCERSTIPTCMPSSSVPLLAKVLRPRGPCQCAVHRPETTVSRVCVEPLVIVGASRTCMHPRRAGLIRCYPRLARPSGHARFACEEPRLLGCARARMFARSCRP